MKSNQAIVINDSTGEWVLTRNITRVLKAQFNTSVNQSAIYSISSGDNITEHVLNFASALNKFKNKSTKSVHRI